MSILVRLRRFIIPAGVGLILLVAILYYDLSVLPQRRAYLDNRNFRALKTLSNQLFQSINAFDKMMDNATDAGLKSRSLKPYFKSQAPNLEESTYLDSKPIVGDDYGDPPKIAVATDEGTHFLYLAFKRGDSGKYAIRTDLEKLISKLSKQCPFDAVVLAQSDGTVIYQTSPPNVGMASINALENASEDAKRGKADKLIAFDSLARSSRLEQVSIAGATYRLYSQPVQLPFAQADPLIKRERGGDNGVASKPWILCGLEREERFRTESRSYSETEVLWISAVILLAIAAFPFLKLHLSSAAERVRRADVAAVAIATCFATTILTFVFLDLVYWKEPRGESREQQMKALAMAIDKNFDQEKEAAFNQLQAFYDNKQLKLSQTLMSRPAGPSDHLPTLVNSGKECRPTWACRVNILSDPSFEHGLDSYPYPLFATWTDTRGQQVMKWTTRDSVTPFLNLNDPSVPYYPAIRRAFLSIGTYPTPMEGIGSQYSPNTGENVTIFWKLFDQDGKPVPETIFDQREKQAATGHEDWIHRKWFCASLVTKPISVVDPILPAGFQFAIIKPDGTVVFHSDPTRNLRENFFDETDHNQELRSRVAIRAEGRSFNANYMGRPTRFYLRPMDANANEPWTVVVFRGLHLEESANLELIRVASILYVYYVGLIVFVLLLMQRGGGQQNERSWFWPDSSKPEIYFALMVINSVAVAAQLCLSQLPSLLAVLILGNLLPVVVFGCNLAMLTRTSRNSALVRHLKRYFVFADSSWQLAYIFACASLVAVIAGLPCLACFKVASDVEQSRLIESAQLKLTQDVKDRANHLRSRYIDSGQLRLAADVKTRDNAALAQYWEKILATPEAMEKILATPEGKKTPYFSYHTVLGTKIQSSENTDPTTDPNPFHLVTADVQLHWLDVLLSWRNPLYSEFSADEGFLTQSISSEVWTLGSTSHMERDGLVLTQKDEGREIISPWQPNAIPWNSWWWWAGTALLTTIFFVVVRGTLRKMFLLDLVEPTERTASPLDETEQERQFGDRSQLQQLALVQLAQEGIVNPKDRDTLCELIYERVVEREKGLLRVHSEFAKFVRSAVPPKTIQEWERDRADLRFLSLRTSFLFLGIGLAAFLIYSQSDVLNTWATFVGGLAALIPASLQLLNVVRNGGKNAG